MKKVNIRSHFLLITTVFIALCISACGGGSDNDSGARNSADGSSVPFDFTGVWDVRYNLIKDDCRLVFDILVGVVDQQIIEQNGTQASISGLAGLLTTDNGGIDEDGNFFADNTVSGDVFGNGDFCDFSAATVYNIPFDEDMLSSKTLLDVAITCRSGFQCESQGVGVAVKQVAPPIENEVVETEG